MIAKRLSILDYWNGILEWTTALTFFTLKMIFILSNGKIQLPVELHSIRNGTQLAAATAQIHLKQANSKRMM